MIRKAVKMLNRQRLSLIATVLLASLLITLLSGCWDNRELDSLFIVTGIALDKAPDSDLITVTLQIGKTESKTGASSESGSQEDKNAIILKASGRTPLHGIKRLNFNSSRSLFYEHNQAVLFSSELAREGLKEYLDFFLRDYESRMEVPVFVTDGPTDRILAVDLEQEQSAGMYLARVIQDLSKLSPYYKVRMLDFLSRTREETVSALIPMVAAYDEEDLQKLQICGMAIFKDGKMLDSLNNYETLGYILAMGDVKLIGIEAQSEKGHVIFNTINLDTKRDVKLRQDGGVQVKLSVEGALGIGELKGFNGMDFPKVIPELTKMAEERIKEQIAETFEKAKSLEADIYAIGSEIHRKHPKKWEQMKSSWGSVFSNIDLTVDVKVEIPETGKSMISLEMEGASHEDR